MVEINTRKRGNKWEYRFEAAKINGKRNQISKGGFKTKKEALEAGTKALAEYNSAGFHFTPSEISFSDYLDLWIKEYCLTNLKQTTIENYEKKIRLYIRPVLGEYKLKALTSAVLQCYINDVFNEGFSRTTLSVIKGILSGSMSYAVEPLGFIQHSPMLLVKLPSPRATSKTPTRKKVREVIPQEQIEKIFEHFPEGHQYYIPLNFAYRCGLRLGEAFALRWEDIDFDNATLNVSYQVQSFANKWTFVLPKYDSIRQIKLDTFMIDILKRHKKKILENKLLYGEYYRHLYLNENNQINELDGKEINLICVRENGSYLHPRVMQHCSRVIHYKLNFKKFDYHSLRHTHSTLLLENGANPKAVQERLGHKNLDETWNTYVHPTEKMQEETIKILEQF